MDVAQARRIKSALILRRENMTSLSRKLNLPYGSVVSNIHGYRNNRKLQEKIAEFLHIPVEELFSFKKGKN